MTRYTHYVKAYTCIIYTVVGGSRRTDPADYVCAEAVLALLTVVLPALAGSALQGGAFVQSHDTLGCHDGLPQSKFFGVGPP